MNRKQCNLLIILLFLSSFIIAQKPYYKTYKWDYSPAYNVNTSDSVEVITNKDKTVIEFYFDKNDNLIEYELKHKIIWVNSDEQIEENNKIYLPLSETSELLVNKARVITSDGKVIELDKSKILTAENEETKRVYKYFTFEGVEKGSFVEYYYVLRKNPNYKGSRIDLQNEHEKYNVEFDLYAPNNLVFEFKSYNDLASIQHDTTSTDKLHWTLNLDTVPALEIEAGAPYNACKQFLIYKLDKNLNSHVYDISSYAKVCENVYSYLHSNIPKSATKALKKFLATSDAESHNNEEDKIRALEDYIKKNIFLVDASNNELGDISYILDNKVASNTGLVMLYSRLFELMDIKAQLVFTCDRDDLKFDKKFEADIFLKEYLFYFPKTKMYMSPTELYSRLGFPPPQLTLNYGLFLKEVSIGDYKTGVGKIRFIDPVSYDKNFDFMKIDLNFSKEDITNTTIKIEKSSGGYYAMFLQPYMHLFDEKTKKEVIETHIKYINDDIEIIDKEVLYDNAEDFGKNPFTVIANVTTDAFVEKAGNKYLFKLGELIGTQVEMYQEKERKLPLEIQFNRNYHREISFTIPEGYKIVNPDDIIIDNEYNKDGEILMKFISSYVIEGNKVVVNADEYYKIIEVSPDIFEQYRAVINSAADFNKITLILEKVL